MFTRYSLKCKGISGRGGLGLERPIIGRPQELLKLVQVGEDVIDLFWVEAILIKTGPDIVFDGALGALDRIMGRLSGRRAPS
jgi:hypothetical protein